MADRDAHFDVTATDKSGPAVTAAARGLDNLARKESEAERQMRQLERETAQLRNKMLETAAAAKVLGHEFAKTGDAKVLKDFEKLTREADKLGRVLKKIEPPKVEPPKPDASKNIARDLFKGLPAEAKKAGLLAGELSLQGIADSFKALPSEVKTGLIGGLVGAVAAGAPFIASALEGAVLAGIAGGGIAAGLIIAANDPRVQDAYAVLGTSITRDLSDSAKPFADELLSVAPELASAFNRQVPRIRSTFATLSTAIEPLARGAVGFADNIAPGLQRAAIAGTSIVKGLASQLPALGAAVGHLLDAFAKAGPAAKQALMGITDDVIVLIHVLALGAEAAAPLLNALAKFDSFVNPISGLNREGKETVKWVQPSGQAAGQAAVDYAQLAQSMGNTANQANALNTAFSTLFNQAMSLDQANLAVKQGYLALSQSVKDNGTSLKDNTDKGLANQQAILSQVQTLDQKRQAEIAAGNGTKEATDKANAAYASNVAALRQVLVNLGFAAADVDKLIGKYQQLAATPDITVKVTTVYRTDGTVSRPGQGNSQGAKLSAMDDWQAATFAAGASAASRGNSIQRTGGPVEVHSEQTIYVDLDGAPFRAMTARIVSASEKRQAWRAKVGKR